MRVPLPCTVVWGLLSVPNCRGKFAVDCAQIVSDLSPEQCGVVTRRDYIVEVSARIHVQEIMWRVRTVWTCEDFRRSSAIRRKR